MSYVLIYNVTILSIQTYTFAKMVKLIHKRSENNFLLMKVLCMILIDVVGNVLALLKLFGVANVWQASRNFMEKCILVFIQDWNVVPFHVVVFSVCVLEN